MKYWHNIAENHGVRLHYIDSDLDSDHSLTPLLISPGLSEMAQEYADFLEYMLPRRCIVLSYRGRGNSGTPIDGYNLDEHVSDLVTVAKTANLQFHHVLGYSRGVSYALSYVHQNREIVKSLIIQDYPAEHKQMPVGWSEGYINDYLIPFNRTNNIRPEAVRGIQRDSTQIDLHGELNIPVLLQMGSLEGSLLTTEHVNLMQEQYKHIVIREYTNSGHDIKNSEKHALYKDIKDFLANSV